MIKILFHKKISLTRKFILTACFLICGWFVYAEGVNDSYFDTQVKMVKCYPNPAISFINLEVPGNFVAKNYSLQIYSFSGKKMFEKDITNAKITVNFSNDFYRGVYIYHLHDKAGKIIETGKFQVVR
ncbi:MAG: T9SS type A sorting domain-containing protein [Ginsengibacter sp.]